MSSWDLATFRFINGLAGRSGWGDALGVFLAKYLILLLVGGLLTAAAWHYWSDRRRPDRWHWPLTALRAELATVSAWGGNALIGWLWFRARPLDAVSGVQALIDAPLTAKSFPSDHATIAFAVAFSVFFADRSWGWPFLALAALVSLGRVIVGVHYPSDVVAGCLLGFFWAALVRWIDGRWGGWHLWLRAVPADRPKISH